MIKILYVEDEPFLAKIVKETLESKGYEIIYAKNGLEAVALFNELEVQLCVFDIMLPGKNGYQLAEEVRSKDKSIPIIFLTAKNQTQDLVKGFEVGGNDYLKKPFSMEELIVRIENLLNLSNLHSKEETSFTISDCILFDYDLMELKVDDRSVKLSHKENEILRLLTINKNEVTDRKILLQKVWGDDSYYNSRTLDVYITKLRNYFKTKDDIIIQTLKGVGYKFLVK